MMNQPQKPDPQAGDAWRRANAVCERFEKAWLEGREPAIADFLEGAEGEDRRRLLQQLLSIDAHHRGRQGATLAFDDYLTQFPDEASLIHQVFMYQTRPEPGTLPSSGVDSTIAANDSLAEGQPMPRWSAPRFRILRSHAKGGFGEVFLAQDLEFHREVALKQIQLHQLHDPTARMEFFREGRITGRLEHPGIAPVYSLGEFADGRLFYAMRFIRGESLKDAIGRFHDASKPLSTERPTTSPSTGASAVGASSAGATINPELELRQLLGRFIQVCYAAAFAHSRGVVHRDIKPSNIMLGDFGEALLVDWGLARPTGAPDAATPHAQEVCSDLNTATRRGQVKGTPAYMSPEQARAENHLLGPAADVYGLGATLYTLLTGKIPIQGKTTAEVLHNVAEGRITPPRDRAPRRRIDRRLEAICMKALAREPRSRYATATALAEDIEHFLADEPITALAESWASRAARFGRKHRGVAATLAAGLLLLAAVMLVVAFREGRLRAEAERNFVSAKMAVDNYVQTVTNADLLQEERFKPLLKELLRDANHFYQDLLQRNEHRPGRTEEFGNALFDVALISSKSGDVEQAKSAYQRSIQVWEQLAAKQPTVWKYRENLATSWMNLGVNQVATSEFAEARVSLRRGIEVAEELAADAPAVARHQHTLAQCYSSFSGLLGLMSDPAEREIIQRALRIREKLAADHPAMGEYQNALASSLNNWGVSRQEASDLTAARYSFQRAVEVREKLAATHPAETDYQSALARSLRNLGHLQIEMAELSAAADSFKRAIDIEEKLVADHPTVASYQHELSGSYSLLGAVRRAASDLPAARDCYKRAVDLNAKLVADHPTVSEYQRALGIRYFDLANLHHATSNFAAEQDCLKQSIDILETLVAEHPTVADYQHVLASSHNNLGQSQLAASNVAAARESFQRGFDIYEKLVADNPSNRHYQNGRGLACENLGLALVAASDLPAANALYELAIGVQQQLVADNPDVVEYKERLANSYSLLAKLQRQMSQAIAARDNHQRSIAVIAELATTHPDKQQYAKILVDAIHELAAQEREQQNFAQALDWLSLAEPGLRRATLSEPMAPAQKQLLRDHQAHLALAHLGLGRHAEAVAASREMARNALQPIHFVYAANVASQAMGLVAQGRPAAELAESETAAREQYAQLAVEFLTQAVEAGFDDRMALVRDEHFLPLQSRLEFQRLLELMPSDPN